MRIGTATEELLRECGAAQADVIAPAAKSRFLAMVLRVEQWFATRASARELYGLDESALADIGLSRADIEAVNQRASILSSFRRASL
jgi:uncharacterized protein YjiS (DUF1127 family)